MEEKRIYFKQPLTTTDGVSYEAGKFYHVEEQFADELIGDGVAVTEEQLEEERTKAAN